MESVLILNNIRSAHNVGSMFRTADGAGVSHIYLCGYTPGPEGAHGKERQQFTKVSLGAETMVPSSRAEELGPLLKKLKEDGYTILAIELDPKAISIFDYKKKEGEKLAIVMGNEVDGISKETLDLADHILVIHMQGQKESLNVSVACGVALFTLLK